MWWLKLVIEEMETGQSLGLIAQPVQFMWGTSGQ